MPPHMAPRRNRKVGMRRIDAAIDALVPYGFTKEIICSTIDKLLKVYDDAAAWHVIEESNYRLVIDTILEDQEQEEKQHQEKNGMQTRASEADGTETNNALEQLSVKDQGQSSSTAREATAPLPPSDPACQQGLPASCQCCQQSQQNQLTNLRPRRPPCYGWISETESESEEEDDALLQQATEVLPSQRVRKRPRGWDVRPCDT